MPDPTTGRSKRAVSRQLQRLVTRQAGIRPRNDGWDCTAEPGSVGAAEKRRAGGAAAMPRGARCTGNRKRQSPGSASLRAGNGPPQTMRTPAASGRRSSRLPSPRPTSAGSRCASVAAAREAGGASAGRRGRRDRRRCPSRGRPVPRRQSGRGRPPEAARRRGAREATRRSRGLRRIDVGVHPRIPPCRPTDRALCCEPQRLQPALSCRVAKGYHEGRFAFAPPSAPRGRRRRGASCAPASIHGRGITTSSVATGSSGSWNSASAGLLSVPFRPVR
jgi:hypothetical protein